MPTPIDPKRLPGLKAALGQYGEEEMAPQRALADLYGVANSRFTTLVKTRFPDFPPPTRHEDKSHWYPARSAIQSMIAYMENSSAKAKRQARRHSAIMGRTVAPAADETAPPVAPSATPVAESTPSVAEREPLSASELDRLASAQTRLFKLRREQGLYTLTSEVKRIARGVNTIINREVSNLVNVLDPNGELPLPQRQTLARKQRDILLKVADELGRFLEDEDAERRGGIADARGRADRDHDGPLPRRRSRDMGAAA